MPTNTAAFDYDFALAGVSGGPGQSKSYRTRAVRGPFVDCTTGLLLPMLEECATLPVSIWQEELEQWDVPYTHLGQRPHNALLSDRGLQARLLSASLYTLGNPKNVLADRTDYFGFQCALRRYSNMPRGFNVLRLLYWMSLQDDYTIARMALSNWGIKHDFWGLLRPPPKETSAWDALLSSEENQINYPELAGFLERVFAVSSTPLPGAVQQRLSGGGTPFPAVVALKSKTLHLFHHPVALDCASNASYRQVLLKSTLLPPRPNDADAFGYKRGLLLHGPPPADLHRELIGLSCERKPQVLVITSPMEEVMVPAPHTWTLLIKTWQAKLVVQGTYVAQGGPPFAWSYFTVPEHPNAELDYTVSVRPPQRQPLMGTYEKVRYANRQNTSYATQSLESLLPVITQVTLNVLLSWSGLEEGQAVVRNWSIISGPSILPSSLDNVYVDSSTEYLKLLHELSNIKGGALHTFYAPDMHAMRRVDFFHLGPGSSDPQELAAASLRLGQSYPLVLSQLASVQEANSSEEGADYVRRPEASNALEDTTTHQPHWSLMPLICWDFTDPEEPTVLTNDLLDMQQLILERLLPVAPKLPSLEASEYLVHPLDDNARVDWHNCHGLSKWRKRVASNYKRYQTEVKFATSSAAAALKHGLGVSGEQEDLDDGDSWGDVEEKEAPQHLASGSHQRNKPASVTKSRGGHPQAGKKRVVVNLDAEDDDDDDDDEEDQPKSGKRPRTKRLTRGRFDSKRAKPAATNNSPSTSAVTQRSRSKKGSQSSKSVDYEVEHILGYDGKKYLVQWKNGPGGEVYDNTREPEENVSGSLSLLRRFYRRNPDAPLPTDGMLRAIVESSLAADQERRENSRTLLQEAATDDWLSGEEESDGLANSD
jgi:hypothetical protein